MTKQLINTEPIREDIKNKLLEQFNLSTYMNTDKIDLRIDIKDIINKYIEEQHVVDPIVYITTKAYLKMRLLVDKFDKEIGWYGIVNKVPGIDSAYVIEDIIVYPQHVTGTTCEQDESKMFEFEMNLTTDQINHKRFQGHSHVNMATTPSGVDENFYQELLKQVTDYFIITITNKRNEYTTRFYDITNNIMYEDVPIILIDEQGNILSDWYDEQIEKNITTRQIEIPKTHARQLALNDDWNYLDDWYYEHYDKIGGSIYDKRKRNKKSKSN